MKLMLIVAVLFTGAHSFAAVLPSRAIADTVIERPAYSLTKMNFWKSMGGMILPGRLFIFSLKNETRAKAWWAEAYY